MPARRLTRVTFGATPETPKSLAAAPMVAATCVPWPLSSWSLGSTQPRNSHGPSTTSPFGSVGMSTVKLRDRSLSKFGRSEEHTSELQSRENLVCRLLLEKKNEQEYTQ